MSNEVKDLKAKNHALSEQIQTLLQLVENLGSQVDNLTLEKNNIFTLYQLAKARYEQAEDQLLALGHPVEAEP